MARLRIEFNNAGLREALRTDQVTRPLHDHADRVAARAQATAPVGESGAYRDSIHVEMVDQPSWERPRARVVADDYKAQWIEMGYTTRSGGHVEGQRILGKAADL